MALIPRFLRTLLIAALALAALAAAAAGVAYYTFSRDLPDVGSLKDVQLQQPMLVRAADGRLMGIFGENRRVPVDINKVPRRIKDAFVATEDVGFYEHGGLDYKGIGRALWMMLSERDKRTPGGSTITQQVARQFFLSPERSFKRKFREMLLARRIEQQLSKDEILELYLNKSFFGNRNYGIAAAAEYYYGKTLEQLTLGEIATLAATPKFPSTANPMDGPERNRERRDDYILPRMVQYGFATQAEASEAAAEPMHAAPHEREIEVYAPYVAEMVRQEMLTRFGPKALDQGFDVTTTLDPKLQLAADIAVRHGLRTYDHRHGWRGAEKHLELPLTETPEQSARRLAPFPEQAGLVPVLVLRTRKDGGADAVRASGESMDLPAAMAASWPGRSPASLFKRGDIARITRTKDGKWVLEQLPAAQSALLSIDADSGALRALVGGLSFNGNSFNRATQARRQPGSSFKPFVYAAAMERGYNPGSIVLDAPVVFRDRANHVWRPQNDGGGFAGPIRLREALVRSRNLVSVRLLDAIGLDYAIKFISHFGFQEKELPRNLSMSLGSATLRPIDVARGYAAFANGGFRVNVWFIDTVRGPDGKLVFKENPPMACRGCVGAGAAPAVATTQNSAPAVVDGFNLGAADGTTDTDPSNPKTPSKGKTASTDTKPPAPMPPKALPAGAVIAPRALDERVAFQLVSMMEDVVKRGTATDARALKREDVGGKTGSTNDHRDAWFAGFGGNTVTVVWVGRDDDKTLGYGEYGGKAALPIWIDYMRDALAGQPIMQRDPPEGMAKAGGEWVKTEDFERMQDEIDYSQAPRETKDTAPARDAQQAAPEEASYDIF